MKIAALYIRVSTERQSEEGYSVEFQEEKLKAYCKAMNYIVGDTFIDPGYSGSNLKRPAMQTLIERIAEFDAVIVLKLDRLSRSQKDTLYLIEEIFMPNNVAFVSLSESFDTGTPFGRAMVGILSVFAQLERENIKDRMLSGRIQRASEGLHNGQSNTPIGYRYIKEKIITDENGNQIAKEKGRLVVDKYEKQQILDVCDLYLKGYGSVRILEEMRKKGYKTRYGFWKNRSTVNAVLFNSVYRGLVTFEGKEYKGQHERIISDELYTKLLEQRLARSTGSAFKRTYLLSGLLWCAHCGGRVAGKNAHGKHYYACYSATKSAKHMIKDPNCPLPSFPADKLESEVVGEIMDIYNNCDKYIKQHKEEHKQPDMTIYEKRLNTLERQKKRLMDLYQFGDIEAAEVRQRIDTIQEEENGIKKAMKAVIEYDYDGFKESVQALGDDWEDLSTNEKREYMMEIIKKIIIDSHGHLKIVVNVKCGDNA